LLIELVGEELVMSMEEWAWSLTAAAVSLAREDPEPASWFLQAYLKLAPGGLG
jgi:hypothetical protein